MCRNGDILALVLFFSDRPRFVTVTNGVIETFLFTNENFCISFA